MSHFFAARPTPHTVRVSSTAVPLRMGVKFALARSAAYYVLKIVIFLDLFYTSALVYRRYLVITNTYTLYSGPCLYSRRSVETHCAGTYLLTDGWATLNVDETAIGRRRWVLLRCVVSMKCAVSGFGRFMVVQTGEFNSSRWPAVCSWCRLRGGKVVGPKAGYNKTRAAAAEGGRRGKYKKDVRSCGMCFSCTL